MHHPPDLLTTERLSMRRWRVADAAPLEPVLRANVGRLEAWIPRDVAAPAPAAELEARLARYAADFDAGRTWTYALYTPDEGELLGGAGLYPRDAGGRVPFSAADRLEIGYWLRADATGRGYATEAARALLAAAFALPRITRVEIRCDPRNAPSAAVPRRLGFHLADTLTETDPEHDGASRQTQVWAYEVGTTS